MKDVSKKQEEPVSDAALINELIQLMGHFRHDWMNKSAADKRKLKFAEV